METFEYINKGGIVLGYGCRVGDKVIINTKSEDGWFNTEEEAKKAGKDFKKSLTKNK